VQVNSATGPKRQLKAPAAICIVLTPCTAGEVLKVKSVVMLPFNKLTESAGIPFTVKSLASTLAGSTGSLTLRLKSVGGTVTMLPQPAVLTEQGGAVGVGVGVPAAAGSLSRSHPKRSFHFQSKLPCGRIVQQAHCS